jgi:P-type Ca2+ transporter type 2C
MERPPRDPGEELFSGKTLLLSVLQGVSVLVIVLAVFSVAMHCGQGDDEARALTFTTLIIANLGLIFANRSWSRLIITTLRSPNRALWWVSGGALGFLAMVLFTPFLLNLFHFKRLHPDDLLLCLVAGICSVLWFEGSKFAGRRRKTRNA